MTISPMLMFCVLMWCVYIAICKGWRMPCKSEGAQTLGMRTISHLGGSGGMLPQEGLEFLTPRECFWGFLTVVLSFFFIVCKPSSIYPHLSAYNMSLTGLSNHSLCISIGNHTRSIWLYIIIYWTLTRNTNIWACVESNTLDIFPYQVKNKNRFRILVDMCAKNRFKVPVI